jgi:hypothetical protein
MIKLKKSGHLVRVMLDGDGVRLAVTDPDGKTSGALIPSCDSPNLVAARLTSSFVEDGWDIA